MLARAPHPKSTGGRSSAYTCLQLRLHLPKNPLVFNSTNSSCLTHSRTASAALGGLEREGERGPERADFAGRAVVLGRPKVAIHTVSRRLSLIHISEPTRLGMISY